MSTSWVCKIDSGDFDERNEPIQYWFTYVVGSMDTMVNMATNKYWWEGDRESEASGILLEKVMHIAHEEQFYDSEYSAWESNCQFWAHKN